MAKKICLNCGLQHPATADFCPECGRPIEDAIRVESGVKIRSTIIATGCLYCGLQLPATADFCPECGRPIERGFEIRPIQESETDCHHKKMKEKDTLIRHQAFYYDASDTFAPTKEEAHPGKCSKREAPLDRSERNTTHALLTR